MSPPDIPDLRVKMSSPRRPQFYTEQFGGKVGEDEGLIPTGLEVSFRDNL